MGNAGIRNTCYNIRVNRISVSLCKHASAAIAHLLYIYTFIRCCRISVVNPEERTDLHFLSRLNQSFNSVCCYKYDLSGAKFLIIFVTQINIGMTLKGQTVGPLFVANLHRSSAHLVPGCINSVFCHEKQRHGAVDQTLDILDTLHKIVLFTDQGSDQLCHIDSSVGHLLKMYLGRIIHPLQKFIIIVDLSHKGKGKASNPGTEQKGLRFIIRNTSDSHISLHGTHIPVKFCTERCVFNVVDGTVKSMFSVNSHTAAACSQMRMIIHSVKKFQYAVAFRCYSKKSAHNVLLSASIVLTIPVIVRTSIIATSIA